MTLPHAVYGSATGFGDYRILASTAQFDERLQSTIVHYANLEGSARSIPFVPIFSFYSLDKSVWAFTRTLYLGPTPRGNDYLVHAIVLDVAALERIDYKPFALADARLFASQKPLEGSVLKPLLLEDARFTLRTFLFDNISIASCIRALSRGPLRLRIEDDAHAAAVCREIHESLPPDDRLSTTFCTRFSYGRSLAFSLAAFVAADEVRVRETGTDAILTDFPPASAAGSDLFDRWATEIRGQADLDLVGLSIVRDPRETFALLDGVPQLRLGTSHDGGSDIRGLENASALVLRKENRGRDLVRSALSGALAVALSERARAGQSFDACAKLCNDIEPSVRRDAVRWIRELKTTPAEAWMAEMLLLLTDASLSEVSEGLQRTERERAMLATLFVQNASAFRAFLTTILGRMRDRFGAEAASVAAEAAPLLAGDRDALLSFVRVMEETASRDTDGPRRTAWLLAIVRDVFTKAGIAPTIPARIILTNGLLASVNDAEIETFAPAFFLLEEKLASTLNATPAAERSTLYRTLANVAQARLREGWAPRSPAAAEVVRRVLLGGAEVGADTAHLTIMVFLASPVVPASDLVIVIELVAATGVTDAQAALLIRTLQTLARRSGKGVSVARRTLIVLRQAARHHPPRTLWSRLRWYLRMRSLSEVVG